MTTQRGKKLYKYKLNKRLAGGYTISAGIVLSAHKNSGFGNSETAEYFYLFNYSARLALRVSSSFLRVAGSLSPNLA